MEGNQLLKTRRTERRYTGEKVPRELLEEIIETARFAPSWMNTQIARYTIIDNDKMISSIAEIGLAGFTFNQKTMTQTPTLVVLSFKMGQSGTKAPLETLPEGYTPNSWEFFDAGIAAQTFCLSAHEKGVATCIMGIFEEEVIRDVAEIPADEYIASIIPCGFSTRESKTPERLEVADIARFIG